METVQKPILRKLVVAALAILLNGELAAESRFIVIIDSSPRLDDRRAALSKTTQDLVRTGFHERIQPGDTFSMGTAPWTENLLKLEWAPDRAGEFAARASAAAGGIPFGRVSSAARQIALTNLNAALENSSSVTALLLCDGFRPVRGTRFDGQINSALAASREEFKRAAKPILVTLIGRGGEWIQWSAHTNLGAAIRLPEPDIDLAAVEKARALVRNLDFPAAHEENKFVAAAEPVKPEPIKPAEPEPTPVPIAEEKIAAPLIVQSEKVEAAAPRAEPPAPIPSPEPPTQPAVLEAKVEPSIEPARAMSNPPAVMAVAPLVPVPARPAFPWAVLAGSLALVAAAGFAVYRRLTRPPAVAGSLISRSIDETAPARRLKPVTERKRD